MGVHKIAANHRIITNGVDPERVAKSVEIGDTIDTTGSANMPVIKTLGIVWNTNNDEVHIRFKPRHMDDTLTLRRVVSDGGRLYDPLGLILPVTMTGRILQQVCWKVSATWDKPLKDSVSKRWRKWVQKVMHIHRIRMSRPIKRTNQPVNKQRLVTFVDASSEAYGAVAYVQTLYTSGELHANLLAAKGKVASLKKQESIPRMECAAAAMGVEFAAKILKATGLDSQEALYFSDSMTTLWWIRSEKPLKVYVANRICTILDHSERSQWRHVPTDQNPADLPTRTTSVKQLTRSDLWRFGPGFLATLESEWTKEPASTGGPEAIAETKDVEAVLDKVHTQQELPEYSELGLWLRGIWGKYSSATKGLNVTAYCLHAVEFWGAGNLLTTHQTMKDIDLGQLRQQCLHTMLRQEQERHFSDLIHQLKQNTPYKGRYASWRPFIDDEDLIRINGRLSTVSYLQYEQRHPILLTRSMPMSIELAKLHHSENLKHTGGPRQLLTNLREKYWIENGMGAAKQALKECAICQVHKMHDVPYPTAPLHASRHTVVRTFSHIGIDMFGPMEVKIGRGNKRQKRYGIIFTCCFTRAINVEVAGDASAHACFMAFRRHAATYGPPLEINSDRGTNLQQVRTIVHELQTAWEDAQREIGEHYPNIKWTMNPPRTPSFGGHYESLIKTVKMAFKTLVRWPKYSLTDEELLTSLKEAAAMANMRPLTELSEDPSDLPPLRPSDFLNAPTLGIVPNWTEKNFFRGMKTDLDALRQDLWERMRANILANLQRVKHHQPGKPLLVDELVLLRTQEWRADRWPLALVTEVKPGEDGEVRVVKLKYAASSDKPEMQKEGWHSVKNVFRIRLPAPASAKRLY